MIRIPNMDAGLLAGETPEMPMHTMGVLLLGKPPHPVYERLRSALAARLHLIEPFRRRVIEGPLRIAEPQWLEDPDFDLDNHLRRAALPAPGGMRELEAFAGEVAEQLLDRSRPLWEMVVVEGLRGGGVALIVKVHHAAMDGVRLVQLMDVLLDPSPRGRPGESAPDEWVADAEPSLGAMALADARSLLLRPLQALRTVGEIGGSLLRARTHQAAAARAPAAADAPRVFAAPAIPLNGRVSRRRAVAMADVAFADVRAIADAFGTTVNDVVLAASAAALRAWLLARNALPAEDPIATVPVTVRQEGAGDAGVGNRVSMILARLPVHETDPVARLQTINAATSRAKQEHRSHGSDVFRQSADLLLSVATPGMWSTLFTTYSASTLPDRLPVPWNLVVSNLPGPRQALYCAGARVQRIYPFGPLQLGSGLNLTVMSAGDRLCLGALACRRRVPDVRLIADTFVAEIARLRRLASAPRARRRVAAAAVSARPRAKGSSTSGSRSSRSRPARRGSARS